MLLLSLALTGPFDSVEITIRHVGIKRSALNHPAKATSDFFFLGGGIRIALALFPP